MAKLNLISSPDPRFVVTSPGGNTRFYFKGDTVDLKDIEEAVAIRVAKDPGCKFLRMKADVDAAAPKGTEAPASTTDTASTAAPAATATAEASATTAAAANSEAGTTDQSSDGGSSSGGRGSRRSS